MAPKAFPRVIVSLANRVDLFAVGSDPGPGGSVDPRVKVFHADGSLRFDFFAYENAFRGGVRVATGDVTGDGIDDIITGAGPGGGPRVRVFDGSTGSPLDGTLGSFFAFDSTSRTGIFVAAGDVNNDNRDDIIVSQDFGGSSEVRVFDGQNGGLLSSFFAYDENFTGGVRVSSGNVTGDDADEIITAPGFGMASDIRTFHGTTGALLASFTAFEPSFQGGAYLAVGNTHGGGLDEIIVGGGAFQRTDVQIFTFGANTPQFQFDAYGSPEDQNTRRSDFEGSRVAVIDTNSDGQMEILTGRGPSLLPSVKIFSQEGEVEQQFNPFENSIRAGDFVG